MMDRSQLLKVLYVVLRFSQSKTTHQIRLKVAGARWTELLAEDIDYSNKAEEDWLVIYQGERYANEFQLPFLDYEMLNNLQSDML